LKGKLLLFIEFCVAKIASNVTNCKRLNLLEYDKSKEIFSFLASRTVKK
jgi:hypothetical protein